MKSKYGKSLRKILKNDTQINYFINFKGEKIFKSAAVDTCIIILRNFVSNKNFINYSENLTNDFINYNQSDLDSDRFNFYSIDQLNFKKRIEEKFEKLENFKVSIKGGIKTGYNKAFIVKKSIRDKLVKINKKYKQVLVPVLDGKNISSWTIDWPGQFMINSHNGNVRRSIKSINLKKDYPEAYNILRKYKDNLVKRTDKGDHWTNLRDCDYFDKFFENKVMWSDISQKPSFYFDNQKFYALNNSYVMFGEEELLKYLVGILNSDLFKYLFENFYSGGELGNKGFRYIKEFITRVPVPSKSKHKKEIIKLVNEIIASDKKIQKINNISKKINELVEKSYEMTLSEKKLIAK